MQQKSNQTKQELAKQLIKQAVVLEELRLEFMNKDASDIDVFETMSQDASLALVNLLQDDSSRPFADWDSNLNSLSSLMSQLIVLLAQPGVLDKLPEGYRSDAAQNLDDIKEYFKSLENAQYLTDWLDYTLIDQYSPDDEQVERQISYYKFGPAAEKNCSSRFSSYHLDIERFKRMVEIYPSVSKAV